jgi:hypothetical protein
MCYLVDYGSGGEIDGASCALSMATESSGARQGEDEQRSWLTRRGGRK